MSRIEKIKKILSMLIFICILISPIASLYFLHYSKQLTSKSFKEISLLNSEIKQLKAINEKVFRDREDLIFIINQHIAPEIFNRHYFLENYILRYNNVIQYYPKIDELKKAGVLDKDLITLKKKSFFNSDSIITELKEITFDKDNIDYNDYYTYEAYTIYTVANIDDLIINKELVNKLSTIKNISFESKEEFDQAIRETIGVENFKKYSEFINSTIDNTSYWRKLILYAFLIFFALIVVIRLIIAFKLGEHRKIVAEQEIEDNINKAKKNIAEEPEKITPVWDLANYTLQKYYNKNLSHVNSIYTLSIVVMVMGFLLIISILVSAIYYQIEVRLETIGIIAGII